MSDVCCYYDSIDTRKRFKIWFIRFETVWVVLVLWLLAWSPNC